MYRLFFFLSVLICSHLSVIAVKVVVVGRKVTKWSFRESEPSIIPTQFPVTVDCLRQRVTHTIHLLSVFYSNFFNLWYSSHFTFTLFCCCFFSRGTNKSSKRPSSASHRDKLAWITTACFRLRSSWQHASLFDFRLDCVSVNEIRSRQAHQSLQDNEISWFNTRTKKI